MDAIRIVDALAGFAVSQGERCADLTHGGRRDVLRFSGGFLWLTYYLLSRMAIGL